MNLPSLKEAKQRTTNQVEHIYLNKEDNSNLFNDKKYFLKTYGCQMNVHDSEEISFRLENLGLTRTDLLTEADVVILNTCAIRENAHDKVFGFLGRCKHQKALKPNIIIGLCGCMAQEESVANEIIKKHKYIDLVFGTHNIHELEDMLIKRHIQTNINVYSYEGKVYENLNYQRDSKVKAWVNIMYGCDKFCTYCIVPFTRGKERSRNSIDIIKEVEALVKNGYQEVTLLGQNVNAYGKDLANELSFAELLKAISKTNIPRIRFVTSHPWDFTDEMIEVINECSNIMPYIHLPVQSGSNKILKLMGRKYTKEEYLILFNKIKTRIPNVSVTTDIIVGFPNETETDFKDTLDLVDQCQFDGAFTFVFSPREGTPASKMEDNISIVEKEQRLQILNDKINDYSLMNNQKLINQTVKVLIEDNSEKGKNKVFGYTDTMKLVNVTADKAIIGQIVDVEITEAKSFSLNGILK